MIFLDPFLSGWVIYHYFLLDLVIINFPGPFLPPLQDLT